MQKQIKFLNWRSPCFLPAASELMESFMRRVTPSPRRVLHYTADTIGNRPGAGRDAVCFIRWLHAQPDLDSVTD